VVNFARRHSKGDEDISRKQIKELLGLDLATPDMIEAVNFQSKLVPTLTLLLAVYVSPWSLAMRIVVSVAAVLICLGMIYLRDGVLAIARRY
jgi:hypothetical protein